LFEGLREWVPGDDTRIIDWKATARRGKPIARNTRTSGGSRSAGDRRRPAPHRRGGRRSRLESVIAAALHLAHAAVEHDDNIGLLVFADTIQRYVPPARGRRALRGVLEGLAATEGTTGRVRLSRGVPVHGGPEPEARLDRALHRRHRSDRERRPGGAGGDPAAATPADCAVTLRDPASRRWRWPDRRDSGEAFQRAAAEELLGAREAALADMRSRGVMVLDVLPAAAERGGGGAVPSVEATRGAVAASSAPTQESGSRSGCG
jgi:uncharacterized protein (DUF58 family)